jgi:hypothetical protein
VGVLAGGDRDAEVSDEAGGEDPPLAFVADAGQESYALAFGECRQVLASFGAGVPDGDGGVPDRQPLVEARSTVHRQDRDE